MSAAFALAEPADDQPWRHRDWDVVLAHAPRFAVTAWRYLDQLAVSMRPATVDAADNTLRCFAGFLVAEHPDPVSYHHLRAHETVLDLVSRLLLEKKKLQTEHNITRQHQQEG